MGPEAKPAAKRVREANVKKAFHDASKTLKQKAATAVAHWLGRLPAQNKLLRVQHALRYENLLKLLNYDVFGIHNDKETLKKMLKEYKVKYDEIFAGQFDQATVARKLFKKFSKVFHPDRTKAHFEKMTIEAATEVFQSMEHLMSEMEKEMDAASKDQL